MKKNIIISAILIMGFFLQAESTKNDKNMNQIKEFAKELLYKKEDVDAWVNGKLPFGQYDSELGWLVKNCRVQDGVDGSWSTYNYEDDGQGCRKIINYADKKCRINSYGDSFTQCHQVSNGETWQEILAAHLGEPIRNFWRWGMVSLSGLFKNETRRKKDSR